jgi:hypothetical protein
LTISELLTALGKRSPPSGKQPSVVSRGITQRRTHSPAGDFSHGFPAPRHPVGGPDHLVFLAEDKSVHSRRPAPAVSTQLFAQTVPATGLCLGAQVGTMLTLRVGRGPGSGVEFKGKSAGEQRQNTKREVHHGFPEATAMPRWQGNLSRAPLHPGGRWIRKGPPHEAAAGGMRTGARTRDEPEHRGMSIFRKPCSWSGQRATMAAAVATNAPRARAQAPGKCTERPRVAGPAVGSPAWPTGLLALRRAEELLNLA